MSEDRPMTDEELLQRLETCTKNLSAIIAEEGEPLKQSGISDRRRAADDEHASVARALGERGYEIKRVRSDETASTNLVVEKVVGEGEQQVRSLVLEIAE